MKKAEAERIRPGTMETARVGAASETPVTAAKEFPGFAPPWPQPAIAQENFLPSKLVDRLTARPPQGSWKADTTKMLFFDGNQDALENEQFRTLRSRLFLLRKERPLQTILISSPLPKEGKSFIAANLAQAFAQQAEGQVFLIDGDLRSPQLHAQFGTTSEPGLSDYLQGDIDEVEAIQRAPLANLFFLPSGKSVRKPSELLGNGRLKNLLTLVAPWFDWIILDSPPVIPISDAKLLAESCDGVLMVVAAAGTPAESAQKACQEFRKNQVLGVVLNRAEDRIVYRSSYYEKLNGKGKK
jgi:capsular exopolysaccharide synthesis family protein